MAKKKKNKQNNQKRTDSKSNKRIEGLKDVGSAIANTMGRGVGQTGNAIAEVVSQTAKHGIGGAVGALGSILGKGLADVPATIGDVGKAIGGIGKILFNHPEWYEAWGSPYTVGAIMNTPTNVPLYATAGDKTVDYGKLPSIYTMYLAHFKGDESFMKGVTMAINEQYSAIRLVNSGSVNYNQEQLYEYVMYVIACIIAYEDARRAYSLVNYYTVSNLEVPAALLEALGWDANDITRNSANMRNELQRFNNFITNNLPCSNYLITRVRWLYSNIFRDGDAFKAQPFGFVPGFVSWFTSTGQSSSFGHEVTEVPLTDSVTHTLSTYESFTQLTDALIGTVRTGVYPIVVGDYLKAFGDVRVVLTPVEQEVSLIYDEAAMTQFENADILQRDIFYAVSNSNTLTRALNAQHGLQIENNWGFNSPTIEYSFTSSASPLYFVTPGNVTNTPSASSGNLCFNWYKDSITNGELCSATRLKFRGVQTITSNAVQISLHTYGTEVPICMRCREAGKDTDTTLYVHHISYLSGSTVQNFAAESDYVESRRLLSRLDFHPFTDTSRYGTGASNLVYADTLLEMADLENAGQIAMNGFQTIQLNVGASLLRNLAMITLSNRAEVAKDRQTK